MDLKIAVSPSGYDNIGKVVQELEYQFTQLSHAQLRDTATLSKFDVVFINCDSSCNSNAAPAQKAIASYVSNGGTIYASDFAADYIAAAFPGAINFAGRKGPRGKVTAKIVDKGLAARIGSGIQLTFDMSSWMQINNVRKDSQVYVEQNGRPLLVSFRHNKGQVIFTCFHNHAQVSKQEYELLRYLVLKPLMAQSSVEIEDFAGWGTKTEIQETVGTVSPGQASQWYEYDFKGAGSLTAMLNWKGQARLGVEVQGPSGIWQEEGDTQPVRLNVPSASAGRWRYRIIGKDVPGKNFPFVVLIGPATQVSQAPSTVPPLNLFQNLLPPMPPAEPDVLNAITILGEEASATPADNINIRILDE